MPTNESLIACPFCGDDDLLAVCHQSDRGNSSFWTIGCGECGAEMVGDTESATAAAWNRRTHPTPDRDVLAEIAGTLSPLADLGFHGKWRIQSAIRLAQPRGAQKVSKCPSVFRSLGSVGVSEDSSLVERAFFAAWKTKPWWMASQRDYRDFITAYEAAKASEIRDTSYGSGAVQSAAERLSCGAKGSAVYRPAQEGEALTPESAPATGQPVKHCFISCKLPTPHAGPCSTEVSVEQQPVDCRAAFERYAEQHEHRLFPLGTIDHGVWKGTYATPSTRDGFYDFSAGWQAGRATVRESVDLEVAAKALHETNCGHLPQRDQDAIWRRDYDTLLSRAKDCAEAWGLQWRKS